jgi:PPM family protein phosphatase
MLDVEFAQFSDPGRLRDHNEDSLAVAEPVTPECARSHGWLFALADGVGGHDHGEIASQTAVSYLREHFGKASPSEPLGSLLTRLVQEANLRVYETAKKTGPGGSNMATTLVACALRHDRVAVAHAGDSRCYLLRDGKASPLTRDHTVANEHLRMGVLSASAAATAETRHLLARSLGSNLFVNVEVAEHPVFAGDVLLLCSDGMHNSVEASEMAALTRRGADLAAAARKLVALANHRDGSDNISVLLIRVREVERVGMYRGRPYKLR